MKIKNLRNGRNRFSNPRPGCLVLLTYWGLKKAAILETFSNALSWNKIFVFWFKFYWNLFLMVQLTKVNIGSGNGMAPNRQHAIAWTNDEPVYCWIYVSAGFIELTHWGWDKMDAISQTTFSSAFSWMKMFELWLKFDWSLFLRVKLTIFQHWFR